MTHRWEARSLRTHLGNVRGQAMFGVVHGGVGQAMRRHSAAFVESMPFDGIAIGGSLGRDREELLDILTHVRGPPSPSRSPSSSSSSLFSGLGVGWSFGSRDHRDADGRPARPVHLLGIGDEASIAASLPYGIDTFDSAFPTRLGRHGTLLISGGARVNIRNRVHRNDLSPIDPLCKCWTCRHYSRAYLHHLVRAREPLGGQLMTLHNLAYMLRAMAGYRNDILNDRI